MDNHGGELVALCNFNPVKREHYRIGVPFHGTYTEVFNTDAAEFGGQGITNGTFDTEPVADAWLRAVHGADDLPPLSVLYFRLVQEKKRPSP